MNVIEMAMRDADGVDARELEAWRIRRVPFRPRIHDYDLSRRHTEAEGAVSQPGDFHIQRLYAACWRRSAPIVSDLSRHNSVSRVSSRLKRTVTIHREQGKNTGSRA